MVKLDRAVHYPVEGMDLSSYVFREKPTSSMFPRSDEVSISKLIILVVQCEILIRSAVYFLVVY